MKLRIKPTALLLFSFFLLSSANGQSLNSTDLNKINNYTDETDVSKFLSEKGFKFQSKLFDDTKKATELRYHFKTLNIPGEDVTFSLIKSSDSKQVSTTLFFIHNVYYYKELIGDLKKRKYKFEGIRIVENKSYYLFKRNKKTLLTRETQDVNDQTIYEVVVGEL